MLKMPEGASSTLNLLGLDPGTTFIGVGVISFEPENMTIVSSNARTLNGNKLSKGSKQLSETHGDRHARLQALEDELVEVFHELVPISFMCEAPFISMRRPQAYGALVEAVYVIRNAVRRYDIWLPLNTVDPPTAKKAVGAKGNAQKEEMKQRIIALNSELKYNGAIPLADLDEHSIDGLAIAYYRFTQLKEAMQCGNENKAAK